MIVTGVTVWLAELLIDSGLTSYKSGLEMVGSLLGLVAVDCQSSSFTCGLAIIHLIFSLSVEKRRECRGGPRR